MSHLAELDLDSFINNTNMLFANRQLLQIQIPSLFHSPIAHVMLSTVLVLSSICSQTPMPAQRPKRAFTHDIIQVRSLVAFNSEMS